MPDFCVDIHTEGWGSEYLGDREGEIRFEQPNPVTGNFIGIFFTDPAHPINISGRCSGGVIWFLRPTIAPEYFYWGTFVTDKRIKGDRIPLIGQFLMEERENIKKAKRKGTKSETLETGDWIAEKGA